MGFKYQTNTGAIDLPIYRMKYDNDSKNENVQNIKHIIANYR